MNIYSSVIISDRFLETLQYITEPFKPQLYNSKSVYTRSLNAFLRGRLVISGGWFGDRLTTKVVEAVPEGLPSKHLTTIVYDLTVS